MTDTADNADAVRRIQTSATDNAKQGLEFLLATNRSGTSIILSFDKSTGRNSGETKRRAWAAIAPGHT